MQNATLGHRGRKADPLYRVRKLLLLASEVINDDNRTKLLGRLVAGDPHGEVTATLLIVAGDNTDRIRNEASIAVLDGTSPIEASSGRTMRHRLNHSRNRQANNALWRIAMTRLRVDESTIAYAQRRQSQGKTRRENLALPQTLHRTRDPPPAHRPYPSPPDPHRQRTQHGLTLNDTAQALNTHTTRISELERGLRHNRDLAERYQQQLAQAA